MTAVEFYSKDFTPEKGLQYSVVVARHNSKWIFVRKTDNETWEIPAGHIESGETSLDAAHRELKEETGAMNYDLYCVATYSVTKGGNTGYGRLFFAEIKNLGPIADNSEIAETSLMDYMPDELAYPDIQPLLFDKVIEFLGEYPGK